MAFYNGKIEELSSNLKDLEGIVQGKSNNLRVVEDGMAARPIQPSGANGGGSTPAEGAGKRKWYPSGQNMSVQCR